MISAQRSHQLLSMTSVHRYQISDWVTSCELLQHQQLYNSTWNVHLHSMHPWPSQIQTGKTAQAEHGLLAGPHPGSL